MYGYEELASYTSGDIRSNDSLLGFRFYKTRDTDKVITAHEARVKELEAENEKLKQQIRTLENDKEAMYEANLVQQARIKELEEQCTKYQAELMNNDQALNPTISKMETTTPKWISVKDRLPKGSPMLPALTEEGDRIWWGNWHDNNLEIYGITHWLDNAFPPPPTTEDSSVTEKEK